MIALPLYKQIPSILRIFLNMEEKVIPEVGMTRSQRGLPRLSLVRVNETDEAPIDMTLQPAAHEIQNPLMVIGAFARKHRDHGCLIRVRPIRRDPSEGGSDAGSPSIGHD
jgi:hypothetical protein